MAKAELGEPSPLFLAQTERLREAAQLGPVLDLACGRGRHALACAALGASTLAIDRNAEALAALHQRARQRCPPLLALRSDLETDMGIPVKSASCGAILVFRFLFRPLAAAIVSTLRPGGLLLYETFTEGQRALGRPPSNPAFLLKEGELRQLFHEFEILEYREQVTRGERPEALASLVARKPGR